MIEASNSSEPSSTVVSAWPETARSTSGQISGVSSSHQMVKGTPGFSSSTLSITSDQRSSNMSSPSMKPA